MTQRLPRRGRLFQGFEPKSPDAMGNRISTDRQKLRHADATRQLSFVVANWLPTDLINYPASVVILLVSGWDRNQRPSD
jgi:hypothetical protein